MPVDLLNRWYAIQVRQHSEKMVALLLRQKGYEEFLPVYQVPRVHGVQPMVALPKPLFPGYLFCRVGSMASGPIVTTPRVVRIVGIGTHYEPVDDNEIESLMSVARSGLQIRPWPRLEAGVTVEVVCGPLRGCRGVFRTYNKEDQLVVSLTLLQRSVTVAIQREWIATLASAEARKPVGKAKAVDLHHAVSI
jgi:transcriptional antiterminator NusG